jgi:FMN phosphatase YigB (HAD superfamily)
VGELAVSAVALDFGGTLATPGTSPRGRDVVVALERRLGWPSPAGLDEAIEAVRAEAKATYRRGVQTPWELILATAWGRLDVEVPDMAAVVDAVWETVPDAVVDPRAAQAARTLRRTGRVLVLACNTQRPIAYRRRTLATAGLADCFDALVLSSEVGIAKPDRRFYAAVTNAARGEVGCSPEEILFVGDTLNKDVIGPRAFGMRAALLHAGPPPPGLPEGVPIMAHVAELPDLLERWP